MCIGEPTENVNNFSKTKIRGLMNNSKTYAQHWGISKIPFYPTECVFRRLVPIRNTPRWQWRWRAIWNCAHSCWFGPPSGWSARRSSPARSHRRWKIMHYRLEIIDFREVYFPNTLCNDIYLGDSWKICEFLPFGDKWAQLLDINPNVRTFSQLKPFVGVPIEQIPDFLLVNLQEGSADQILLGGRRMCDVLKNVLKISFSSKFQKLVTYVSTLNTRDWYSNSSKVEPMRIDTMFGTRSRNPRNSLNQYQYDSNPEIETSLSPSCPDRSLLRSRLGSLRADSDHFEPLP